MPGLACCANLRKKKADAEAPAAEVDVAEGTVVDKKADEAGEVTKGEEVKEEAKAEGEAAGEDAAKTEGEEKKDEAEASPEAVKVEVEAAKEE